MSPKDTQSPVPGTHDLLISPGKRDYAELLKLRLCPWEKFSDDPDAPVPPAEIHPDRGGGSLQGEGQGPGVPEGWAPTLCHSLPTAALMLISTFSKVYLQRSIESLVWSVEATQAPSRVSRGYR